MPKLIPTMPADAVMTFPPVRTLASPELGAIMALSWAFWESGAAQLPDDDAALSVLARAHTRRWYSLRAAVLPIWRDLRVHLSSVYADRERVTLATHANMAAARQAKRPNVPNARLKLSTADAKLGYGSSAPLVPKIETSKENKRSIDGVLIPDRTTRNNVKRFNDAAE